VGSFSIVAIGTYATSANFHQPRDTTQPFIRKLAQWRGEAVAKLRANAHCLRVIQAQIERNEALLEGLESGATVH
jgi:hypothetical protein